MGNKPIKLSDNYQNLLSQISETYVYGRQKATTAVNSNMIETYWKIGQYIVEFEQSGKIKADYGKALLNNLFKFRKSRQAAFNDALKFKNFVSF